METPGAPPAGKTQSKPNPHATGFQVSRYSYYALGILTLVNFLNYIDRQILPSVAPLMAADLHLTDTEIGAMEAALLLSFTVLAPLFGRLGDRYSRTKLMGRGYHLERSYRPHRRHGPLPVPSWRNSYQRASGPVYSGTFRR